jgi:hypothetical protein
LPDGYGLTRIILRLNNLMRQGTADFSTTLDAKFANS